jgi:hypothetical protein
MAETRDVLARRIAEIAEEAGDRAESDEILQQLKELLALKEEAMNQRARMVEAGHVSEAEMQAARAEVIQTRIEIARRREALTRDRIGERLDNLNARLDDLLIEATRLHTMQQVAEERLAQIRERDLVGLAEKLGEVEMKLRSATDELRQRENVLYQLNADPDKVRLPQIDVVD